MRTIRICPGRLCALIVGNAMAAVSHPAHSAGEPEAENNRQIVTQFAYTFYSQKDVKKAFTTWVAENYIQHNPGIADGRTAAIQALTPLFSSPHNQFAIEKILVDGNLAAIHVRATDGVRKQTVSVVDMYRLDKGKIVEHSDVLQDVPRHSKNAHPMF